MVNSIRKVALVSDFHLDSWHYNFSEINSNFGDNIRFFLKNIIDKCNEYEPDIIFVCGDIFNNGYQFSLKYFRDNPKTVYTPGNHDYYRYNPMDVRNIEFIDNPNYLATPLWTDFAGANPEDIENIWNTISDSYQIPGMLYKDSIYLQNKSVDKIFFEDKEIVATHWPPSWLSVAREFQGSPVNPYFMNQLDEKIKDSNIKLWLCGHTHHKHAYYIGDTLVACNPMGYYGENYTDPDDYEPMILFKDEDENKWKVYVK